MRVTLVMRPRFAARRTDLTCRFPSVIANFEVTRMAAALSEGFGTIAGAVEDMGSYGSSRPLRIVARPFLVDRVIMPNLAQFWKMHPGVEISILPRRDFTGLQQGSFASPSRQ